MSAGCAPSAGSDRLRRHLFSAALQLLTYADQDELLTRAMARGVRWRNASARRGAHLMPAREIINGVLDLVADLPARGTRALDVSCRNGEVLAALAARGFEVRGTRFERGLPPIEGIPIDEGVDLTRGLPYPDASFDLVLLTEVIEHLENHRAALCELARVIRPGGRLVLTTPNIMRLDSRLGFLLSGMHKAKRRQMPLDTPLAEAHRYHNYPPTFALLYYLLRINGLGVERLGHGKVKPLSYVLYALLYPLVAANTRYRLMVRERGDALRALNRELMRWMLDRRVLVEDNLIVRAHKAAASRAPL